MRRSGQFFLISLVLLVACGGVAFGGQEFPNQFNLSTPGARSLGLGGTFLALADDATAAYTNPAGLTNLAQGGPQIAVEYRSWSYSTPFVAEGRLNGNPSLIGLDFGNGLLMADAKSSVSDLSFASLGYVLPRGFTIALYKNQLADYSTSFTSQGFFYDASSQAVGGGPFYPNGGNLTWRTMPSSFFTKVKVDSLGGALAYEFRKPFRSTAERPLSIGIGITRYQLKSETGLLNFALNTGAPLTTVDGLFGRSQFLPAAIDSALTEIGDDSAIGLNYGFLWKLGAKGTWVLGGVYREGPKFRTVRIQDQLIALDDGSRELEENKFKGTLKVPDVLGIGISYSPQNSEGRTKVALDYQISRYSQRLGDFFSGTPDPAFKISDAHEIHLGVEKVLLTYDHFVGTARAGVWQESAHTLEYKGQDPNSKALYPREKTGIHWAGGVGVVIAEDYQIDAAYAHSDRVNTFSFSVVRFFE